MSLMDKNLEEIAKMNVLKERGIITEAEYEIQKQRLLNFNAPRITYNKMSMSLTDAYKRFWTRAFVIKGRACLSEYWYPVLVNFLIFAVLNFLNGYYDFVEILIKMFALVLLVPASTSLVRRIHDTGRSAKFLIAPLLIFVLVFFLLFVLFLLARNLDGLRSVVFVIFGFISFCVFLGFGVTAFVISFFDSELKCNKYGKPYGYNNNDVKKNSIINEVNK